jgi:hypothetical protein
MPSPTQLLTGKLPSMIMTRITNLSGLLLIAGISLGTSCAGPYGASSQSPASPSPSQAVQVPPTPAPTQNPENLMPRIRAEDAIRLVNADQAVIIDVRGTLSYNEEHIKGALDFGLDRIENKDFKGLPRDKQIIAYCT